MTQTLEQFDAELFTAIKNEQNRQIEKLELIASENIVSSRVLEATGSVLTNKYAEGYPKKRYYGGCEHVDVSEQLAIDRAKALFKVDFANVQPHSGSQANMAVYMAALEPGDTFLGLDLVQGGHLTHGSSVNFSGKLYNAVSYGVREADQRIDYDQVRDLARKHHPKMIICGASAYSRIIDFATFGEIAKEFSAYLMADVSHISGLVVTGLHPSPVPHADFVTTTTHKTLRGPRGGMILGKEAVAKKINSRIFPGIQGGPLCHVIAAKAVAFKEAQSPSFKIYCEQIIKNAQALAEALQSLGYNLVSGGTDNHLVLVDLTNKNMTGKVAEVALDLGNITVNKNTIPLETKSPFVTSGIRIGTPALTSRGFKTADMLKVAGFMDQILNHRENEAKILQIGQQVKEFSESFPAFDDQLA